MRNRLALPFYMLITFTFGITSLLMAQLWQPDNGDGTYKNPIIFADYSDPDVVRVGDDFYMVASSFNCMPGIPVLHSKDLVNWKIINHVYEKLPFERYDKPQHGEGSWAPSIRFHEGLFYVYFCTPAEGLFMASTTEPSKKWNLVHVTDVVNWEDPCPVWDSNGDAYLVHSKLCGGILYLHKLSRDGKSILDNGQIIFNDQKNQPTIEGPKFLIRDGYYYILAPAGGVATGWQTVLRSKNIYGPYEQKIVLHQGNTQTNGPHQGGLVDTPSGEWWFIHFQDKDAYGRIVHLQPVEWADGWPMMGKDINNDGIGEPVAIHKKPEIPGNKETYSPQTSDEFNETTPGLQWQWWANPQPEWYSLQENKGKLRLFTNQALAQQGNPWYAPNLLLQKFPAPEFTATTCVTFKPGLAGEKAGLIVMGEEYSAICILNTDEGLVVSRQTAGNYHCDGLPFIINVPLKEGNTVYFKVKVSGNAACDFYYSVDGENFITLGDSFTAKKGRWIGAKVGLFCINPNMQKDSGYADFDWFKIE